MGSGDSAEADDITALPVVTYVDENSITVTVTANNDGSYTFPGSVIAINVAVQTTPDSVYEGPETFSLIATDVNGVIAEASGISTILDNNSPTPEDPEDPVDNDIPTLTVVGESVQEGNVANFAVTLSGESEAPVMLNLTPSTTGSGDSAEADDISAVPVVTYVDANSATITVPANSDGSYTFPGSVIAINVAVQTTQDSVYEGPETFSLIATDVNNIIADASGISTILDNNSPTPEDPEDPVDNDIPTLTVVGESVQEGNVANFAVTLSGASEAPVMLNLIPSTMGSGDSAEADDITALPVVTYVDENSITVTVTANNDGSYTFPGSVTAINVAVQTTQDSVYEGPETFSLIVADVNNVIESTTGTSTIVDNNTPTDPEDPIDNDIPALTVVGESVQEGNVANFSVTLSGESEAPVMLNLTPSTTGSGDSAEADDISAVPVVTYVDANSATITVPANSDGSYTFPGSVIAINVAVQTTQDSVYEGPETFSLIATDVNNIIADASGTSTILDNNSPTPEDPEDPVDNDIPTLTVVGESVQEGNVANFSVTLSGESEAPVMLNLTPSTTGSGDSAEADDISAVPVVTYVDANSATITVSANSDGSYTFPGSVIAINVAVQTTQDSVYEGPETFSLIATDVNNIIADASGTSTILDNNTPTPEDPEDPVDNDIPTLTVVGESVQEGNVANFSVTLSGASEAPVTLNLTPSTTGSGDSAEADDISAVPVVTYVDENSATVTVAVNNDGSYTFPGSVIAINVAVQTTQDSVYEGPETFSLIATDVNGVITEASGISTILDNNSPTPEDPDDPVDNDIPTLTVVGESVQEGNVANFAVTLSGASETPVMLNLIPSTTGGGDSAEANDITALPVVTYVDANSATITVLANSDGSYTFPGSVIAINVAVQTTQDSVYEGPETFSLIATDVNNVIADASGTATIIDSSTVIDESNSVYESALSNGTNSSSDDEIATGNIFANDSLQVGAVLSSINGATPDIAGVITVSTSDGNTLVVNADINSSNFGAYTYTLNNAVSHPAGGDTTQSIADTFTYEITDANGFSQTAVLEINIFDDSPTANAPQTLDITVEPITTNLAIIVDVSSSMSNNDLSLTESAIESLINGYGQLGNVNVNIVQFYGNGYIQTGSNEDSWVDGATGKALNLDTSQSGTDIEQGLRAMVDNGYSGNQPEADQNVMYFFGDGSTYNSYETDFNAYLPSWSSFVNSGAIDKLFAYSVNTDNVASDINRVADNDENVVSPDAVNIKNIDTLNSAVSETVELFAKGSLTFHVDGSTIIDFGADGGHIASITIGNTTANYDASNLLQTINGTHGVFEINFETGDYRYLPTTMTEYTEKIEVTVIDADGDAFSDILLDINVNFEDSLQATVVDGIIEGLEYSTTSGISGFTSASGHFDYAIGDIITFTIGNLTIGQIDMNNITDGKVFLQDIAGVERSDVNDEYVENMAVLLQSLDADGDAYNGIVITEAMREAFSGDSFDLSVISEQNLVSIIEETGHAALSEDAAMEHVQDMLELYAGMDSSEFEQRVLDHNSEYLIDSESIIDSDVSSDTFAWLQSDITEGEKLDLSEILQITTDDELNRFLDFSVGIDAESGEEFTTISISAKGDGNVTQTIVLDGVNIGSDITIMNDMLEEGALLIGDSFPADMGTTDSMMNTIVDEIS
ncbi:hypothetical protein GCM10007916_23290 [Psychromonas marina]|uniref:VWFA domain-containing protein n=2 Tax=Psychromonas marina TaxID=88364 RepID=A0ABQ6E241_9GAMM|nr:hypothetical protein GCM10007916_23290 [Psychromonas marina]